MSRVNSAIFIRASAAARAERQVQRGLYRGL
jgi:hypothetical protein